MVRKSTASAVSVDDAAPAAIPTTTTTTTTTSTNTPTPTPKAAPKEKDDGLNIEDLNLPKSIVQRLAKGVLPPNTQIQKDALLAMSKGATVFVNYLTS
jgi:DNA polymerase epsilon subunit 3